MCMETKYFLNILKTNLKDIKKRKTAIIRSSILTFRNLEEAKKIGKSFSEKYHSITLLYEGSVEQDHGIEKITDISLITIFIEGKEDNIIVGE